MSVESIRLAIRNKYREILGRNYYNDSSRRTYCYKRYSDGTASIFRTLPIVNGDVSLTFAVTSGTKIFDARFKASRV